MLPSTLSPFCCGRPHFPWVVRQLTTDKWCVLTYEDNSGAERSMNDIQLPFLSHIYTADKVFTLLSNLNSDGVRTWVPLLRASIPHHLPGDGSVRLQSKEGFTLLAVTQKVTDRF